MQLVFYTVYDCSVQAEFAALLDAFSRHASVDRVNVRMRGMRMGVDWTEATSRATINRMLKMVDGCRVLRFSTETNGDRWAIRLNERTIAIFAQRMEYLVLLRA